MPTQLIDIPKQGPPPQPKTTGCVPQHFYVSQSVQFA